MDEFLKLLSAREVTVAGLLLFFLIGFARGWWVIGSYYQEIVKQRDSWQAIALDALGVASGTADLAVRRRRPGAKGS